MIGLYNPSHTRANLFSDTETTPAITSLTLDTIFSSGLTTQVSLRPISKKAILLVPHFGPTALVIAASPANQAARDFSLS